MKKNIAALCMILLFITGLLTPVSALVGDVYIGLNERALSGSVQIFSDISPGTADAPNNNNLLIIVLILLLASIVMLVYLKNSANKKQENFAEETKKIMGNLECVISERDKSKAASSQNLQTVVDMLSVPANILDIESMKIIHANDACLKLLESDSPENIVGKDIRDVLFSRKNSDSETDRVALRNLLANESDNSEENTDREIRIFSAVGNPIDVRIDCRQVEYNGGKAAIVVITDLTVQDAANSQQPDEENPESSGVLLKFANVTVLLCEDYFLNQEIAIEMFSQFGVETAVAENGKECMDILLNSGKTFDLIFMDLQMPIMDGYEAARAIREYPKYNNIPIVSLSADAISEVAEECAKAGMNDNITKPIEFDSLTAIFKKWLPENKRMVDLTASQSKADEVPEQPVEVPVPVVEPLHEPPKEALARFGGKRALYDKALRSFAELLPNEWESFESAVLNKEETAKEIHKLKGVAGNLAENEIYKCTVEFEESLRSENPDKILYDKLVTVCKIVKRRIALSIKETDSASTPKAAGTSEELSVLLTRLHDALENYDPGDTTDTIEVMQKSRWESVDESLIGKLYEFAEKYEFDDALDVLNLIKLN